MKFTDLGDPKPSHMYILHCADDTLYVGSTTDLELRVWQHNNGGGASYTRLRLPVRLVYSEEFPSVAEAFAREKQVQKGSRAKRDALVAGGPTAVRANMPTYWKRQKEAAREERRVRRKS